MLKISPTKFFVYCALIFGILLITIIPPFQSPDEDSHFKKAYVISQGKFFPTSRNGVVGYEVPTDMINYIYGKLAYAGNRDKKYTYSEEILDDRLPKDYSDTTFQRFSTVEATPIAYLAPATGILFGKLSAKILGIDGISVTTMLHFARFFSLLLYTFLVYLAIKTTPILKKTFCIIGLLPMSLALAAAISYDSVLIAISLLSTAFILKLIFDDKVEKITYKHAIALGIIAFILLSIKTIYISILLPLIFIPKEKYDGKITKIIKILGIVFAIAVSLYIINKIPLMCLERNAAENFSGQQVNYIINNPIRYIKTWLKTMFYNRNFYFSGMIGIFGLIDTYIPTVYIAIYTLGALAIMLSDFSLCEVKFDWKYKCVAFLGSIFTVFAVFSGMYILWTSIEAGIGVDIITGVQGRYFIPIIPFAMIILSNSILNKNNKIKILMERVLDNSYLVPIIMLCISSVIIFLRYWC